MSSVNGPQKHFWLGTPEEIKNYTGVNQKRLMPIYETYKFTAAKGVGALLLSLALLAGAIAIGVLIHGPLGLILALVLAGASVMLLGYSKYAVGQIRQSEKDWALAMRDILTENSRDDARQIIEESLQLFCGGCSGETALKHTLLDELLKQEDLSWELKVTAEEVKNELPNSLMHRMDQKMQDIDQGIDNVFKKYLLGPIQYILAKLV